MRLGSQDSQLSYAVRLRTVGKHFGDLLLVLAALNAIPLVVALLFNGLRAGAVYALPVAALALLGAVLRRLRCGPGVQTNEALVITSATFLTAALAMSLPLMQSGLGFADALFEAISGVTTTGLTTTRTVADKPICFLFTRAWLQWYGGLGIVVLSLALVMRPGAAARRLAASEEAVVDLAVDTRTHARRVLVIYAALTAVMVLGLFIVGAQPLAAVTYALSSVSTGGFSIHDASLAGLSGWGARTVVLVGALLGAGSFAVYYRWLRSESVRTIWHEMNARGLLVVTLLGAAALVLCLHYLQNMNWGESARQGLSLGVSAQTTAGFSTLDVARLPSAAKAVQMMAMFIGGDLGSTAGGIKMFRLLVVLRVLQHLLARTSITRHTVLPRRLGDQKLTDDVALDALMLIGLFAATIFASWTTFLVYDYPPLDALFEVVSATCTVGLSTGVTSPELPGLLKSVLCADMLLGRLEVVAVLVLAYPRTWVGKRADVT